MEFCGFIYAVCAGVAGVSVFLQPMHRGFGLALLSLNVAGAIRLLSVWTTPHSSQVLLGGLLPITDPSGYVFDAFKLAHGFPMDAFAAKRFFGPAFFSTLFFFSNDNLQACQAVLTVTGMISIAVALLCVCRSLGRAGAAVFAYLSTVYYIDYSGTFMTEVLGFPLGLLGTGILVDAVRRRRPWFALWGLTVLSLALVTRAGAFLALPLLGLWIALESGRSRRQVATWLGAAATSVVGVFVFSLFCTKLLCESGVPMSNVVYSWHGLVTGTDWSQSWQSGLSDKEIWADIIQTIRSDPLCLARGAVRSLRYFFVSNIAFGWARFIPGEAVAYLFMALAGTAVAMSVLRWSRLARLLLVSLIGIVVSLPFCPPWDGGARLYAATMGFQILLPAFAVSFAFTLMPLLRDAKSLRTRLEKCLDSHLVEDGSAGKNRPLIVAVIWISLLLTAGIVLPLALRYTGLATANPSLADPKGNVIVKRGSFLVLDNTRPSRVPTVNANEILDHAGGLIYWRYLPEILKRLPSGALLTTGYQSSRLYVLPSDRIDVGGTARFEGRVYRWGLMSVCVDDRFDDLDFADIQDVDLQFQKYDWLRGFDFAYFPWIHHADLGWWWVYEKDSTPDRLVCCSKALGTIWVDKADFPRLYRYEDQRWWRFDAATGRVMPAN
jgi:hypothetical protein